jgi:hypothetical protein
LPSSSGSGDVGRDPARLVAIVIARNGDMLTLRFRDYPKLTKFSRHRAAVALISAVVP